MFCILVLFVKVVFNKVCLQLQDIGPVDLVICSPPERDLDILSDDDCGGLSRFSVTKHKYLPDKFARMGTSDLFDLILNHDPQKSSLKAIRQRLTAT